MKHLLTLSLAVLCCASSLHADQTVTFPNKAPVISMSFPDSWKITRDKNIVSIASEDSAVQMGLAMLEAGSLKEAVEEAKDSLTESIEDIKWLGEPEKSEINGLNVVFINGQFLIEKEKFAANCAILWAEGSSTFCLLSNVTPIEALQQHGDAMEKVLTSIKAP